MASTSASSVSTLIVKPASAMIPNAPMRETGITTSGTMVVRQSRKKPKMTSTTSASAIRIVSCTSRTDARIWSVWSKPMPSSMPGGRSARISSTRS